MITQKCACQKSYTSIIITSITWAGPRCVQELGAISGSQNRTQRGCVSFCGSIHIYSIYINSPIYLFISIPIDLLIIYSYLNIFNYIYSYLFYLQATTLHNISAQFVVRRLSWNAFIYLTINLETPNINPAYFQLL